LQALEQLAQRREGAEHALKDYREEVEQVYT
jgi:hypothetical protein